MRIDLSEEERSLLRMLIANEVSDLGPEIRHTDRMELRDELRAKKRTLRQLFDRLRAGEPAGTPSAAEEE
jgi:hypothetical protein